MSLSDEALDQAVAPATVGPELRRELFRHSVAELRGGQQDFEGRRAEDQSV